MNEEKVCIWCGNVFQPKNNFQRYCSDACRKSAETKQTTLYRQTHKQQYAEYRARKRSEKRSKGSRRRMSIDEYAMAARAAGMSYGKYMGMMKMKIAREVESCGDVKKQPFFPQG